MENIREVAEAIHFIYEHAAHKMMLEPWTSAVRGSITRPELTSDGFQIVMPTNSKCSVEMREYKGTIFVTVSGPGVNYSSMARDQNRARVIYDAMVNALLAA